jgi:hypothetical protein
MKANRRRASSRDVDLEALERLLQTSFHPFEPRQDFRSGLHDRLSKTPIPPPSPGTVMQYVIISLGGAALAALLLVASVKMMRALLISLGLLQRWSQPRGGLSLPVEAPVSAAPQ